MRRAIVGSILFSVLIGLAACSEPLVPGAPTLQPTATRTSIPNVLPTGIPPAASPAAPKTAEVRVIQSRDAVSFHPFLAVDDASVAFQRLVYAGGLWTRDPQTLQPVPNMAESWTVSQDAKTYTFKLRQDMKWSDGEPITADDFQWTFDQASKPGNKYPYLENFKDIVFYKAKDDYTIQVILKDATCVGLITADAVTPLPQHIWEKLDWSNPSKNPEIQSPTVVSGPFRLKEWKKGDHATFGRNDTYFRGRPLIGPYTVQIVADPALALQMLKGGDVDSAPVGIESFREISQTNSLKVYTWTPAEETWDYVGFNLRRPFVQDADVRHALSYAVPRQAMADQVLAGLAEPTYSAYPPTSGVYNPGVPRYDYNLETAKAILQNAGYTSDANRRLLDKAGVPVKLKIVYNSGNLQRQQMAAMIRQEFAKLGIDLQVVELEFQAYLDYLKKAPFDYDLYLLSWRAPVDPYFLYQVWSEANIPILNPGGYINKDIERLYEASNHPPCDADSRKKVFQKIRSILSNDSPYVFLTSRRGFAFLNPRVVPNEPSRLGIDYRLEKWSLR
ncbi:MAG: ABC transporter substrate-binding protein [Acidobacteriota bacterium]